METVKLSPKELAVLKATYFNEYQDCDYGTDRINNPIWPIAFSDVKNTGLFNSKLEVSAACSSLQRKGLYDTNGHSGHYNATSWITKAGYEALLSNGIDLFNE